VLSFVNKKKRKQKFKKTVVHFVDETKKTKTKMSTIFYVHILLEPLISIN